MECCGRRRAWVGGVPGLGPSGRCWWVLFLTTAWSWPGGTAQHSARSVPRARQRGPHAQRVSALQPRPPPRGPPQAGQQPSPREPREDGTVLCAQERFGGLGGRGEPQGIVPSWGLGAEVMFVAAFPSAHCWGSAPRAASLSLPNTTGTRVGEPHLPDRAVKTYSHDSDLTPCPGQTSPNSCPCRQRGLHPAPCSVPSPGAERWQPAAEGAALPQRHLRHLRRLHPQPGAVPHL